MLHKKKLLKVIDYLYTAKAYDDAMTHYMMDAIDDATLFELLRNPSLFMNIALYNQFTRKYFPQINTSSDIQRAGTPLHRTIIEQTIKQNMTTPEQRRQRIYKINYEQLLRDSNRIRQNKQVPNTTTNNVRIYNIQNKTTRDLTEQHEKLINSQIDKLEKEFRELVEQDEPIIKGPNIKENEEIKKLRKEHKKQIARQNKTLSKNKDNRVKWMTERLKDKPRIYKVWNQTPNPKTRHTITDGQKVPLEEKFEVINDQTGQIDMMDYPGDWKGSPANTANCLCELSFTDDDSDVYDPQKKSVQDEYKDLKEYQENLKKYIDEILEHNTKTQKELREQYIKENGKLPDYITDEKTEIAFTEYNGKSNIIHLFGGKSQLILDKRTGQSNDVLYNNIAKYFHATVKDYEKSKYKQTYDFYTGKGFINFNTWKRVGDSYLTNELHLSSSEVKQQKKVYTEKEKELMELAVPLGINTMVYRGQKDIFHDLNQGSEGVWASFTSTSLGIGSAWGYANGNYIYEIPLKEYNKVIPILQQGVNTKEIEMLLPPGQRFKVGIVRQELGCTIIPITLI